MSIPQESAKKKTLKSSYRSFLFSTGLYVNNLCTQDENVLKRLRGHAGSSKSSIHSDATNTKALCPRSYYFFRALSLFNLV